MDNIVGAAVQSLAGAGFKARAVPTTRLPDLQEDIEKLVRDGLLDRDLHKFLVPYFRPLESLPKDLPEVRTVFIAAVWQPVTRSHFTFEGKSYPVDLPPTYIDADDARIREALEKVLTPAGYRVARARLPAKTLAVRSGLAQYGRNNVTYVPGFGSFHRLVAFYSDCPGAVDTWQEPSLMKACRDCTACRDNCPTQCIPTDRFLIHAENCLTWHNEREEDFAAWIKPEWHNALVGCMRCQDVCPVDKAQMAEGSRRGPAFSEVETRLILAKTPWDALPEETRARLRAIAQEDLYALLPRNLKALIESR